MTDDIVNPWVNEMNTGHECISGCWQQLNIDDQL